jgi:uncharacterized protein
MMRYFLIRFILPLIAFLVIRYLVKTMWGTYKTSVPAANQGGDESVRMGGDLMKDPVCGTYVAANAAVTKIVNGRSLHFCSAACRDKYRAA